MTSDQVDEVTADLLLDALMEYRLAVGRRSRAFISTLSEDELDRPIADGAVDLALEAGALGPNARWVVDRWRSNEAIERTITWAMVGHSNWHLGQIAIIRNQLVRGKA